MIRKYLYLLVFLLLIPAIYVYATDGVSGVEHPAKVNSVVTPDKVCGVSGLAAAGGTDYTADANCQGAWLFADDLTDESGKGNTLTISSEPTYTTTRPSGYSTGKSLHFDGTDDYVYRDDGDLSADFPGDAAETDDFAVCFWFKHDDDGDAEHFCSKGSDFQIRLDTGEDWGVTVNDGAEGHTWENIADFTGNANWHHFCFSFDGSATEGTAWISSESAFGDVVNGTTETFTGVNFMDGSNWAWVIGCYNKTGTYFDGYIYQPIVFDRTIDGTAAEGMWTTGITGAD